MTGGPGTRGRGAAAGRRARRAAIAAAAAAVAAWTAWLAFAAAPEVPAVAAVRAAHRPSDLPLLDRHGAVIHELRVDPRRRRLAWCPLAEISPALRAAVVAAEDRRFYAHGGADLRALAAAALDRLGAGARRLAGGAAGAGRGASTITMQLAASLDPALARPGGGRTLGQKWRQIRLARALEARWSKDEILEAYLNRVTFRGELVGAGAAAGVLFGKRPHGLAAAEALALAALLQGPNAAPGAVLRRAARLAPAAGLAVEPAALGAAVAAAFDAPRGGGPRAALAPHAARRLLRAGGGPVRSTLDAGLQRAAAAALRRALVDLRGRRARDGAVLAVENASGEVLAYVGGSGALSGAPFVDAVRARRQPGSALKPFLYGAALERRLLTPASLLADLPLELAVAGGLYRPRDYDERFRGLVSLRTALAASLNVPAVRALGLIGEEAFAARLRALGFAGVAESGDWYGPALALGSAEVSLWELVNAYRTLARDGVWSPLVLARAEEGGGPGGDSGGPRTGSHPLADDPPAEPRRVLSAAAAFLVSDVLADRESRSATFGLESPLATPFWSAVKTGTSKDMRDNWCVGYSRRYTVGVWVGNADGAPMRAVSGVDGAAPVWLEVMTRLHRDAPSPPPAPPVGVVAREVAFPGGVEAPRREWFLAGTEPPPGGRALATGGGRIVTPVAGTIVALDPDMPPDRQRVPLEAEGAAAGARWLVDGADLGPARGLALWEPRPGRHELALVDGSGRAIDTAVFEVRGGAATAR